jgi:uncharacterized protein (DUF433 family)
MLTIPEETNPMKNEPGISRDPEILSGTPVFAGTRVPASTLFDYLEGGHNLDEFLDDFPTVRREQAQSVLEHFRSSRISAR